MPVIYQQTGALLGEVKDIYYDPIASQIMGLVVEEKGWFRGARLVPYEKVEKIDAQGVYIMAQEAIIKLGEDKELGRSFDHRMDIRGYPMFRGTEEVGIIRDLLIDTASPKIYGYEISDGLISDLLTGREAIILSGDITVEDGKVLVSEIRKGDLS